MKANKTTELNSKANQALAAVKASLSPGDTKALSAYLRAVEEQHMERMVHSSEPTIAQARIKQIREISDALWPT